MPAVAGSRARLLSQISCLALIAIAAAGCSSETSRFTGIHGRGETTGSIAPARSAPVGRVDSHPLPQTSAVPPPSRPAYMAGGGVSGGGRGFGSYSPGAGEVTGSVAPPPPPPPPVQAAIVPPPPPPAPRSNWSWDGGTAITVHRGDTLDKIAARHGVPPAAILQANGIMSASAIRPGQRLVIPRYDTAATGSVAPPRVAAAAPPRPAPPPPARAAAGGVHVVAPGETLSRISRRYGKSISEIARANRIEPHARLKIGDRIVIPGVRTAAAAPPVAAPPARRHVAAVKPPAPAPVIAQPRTAPVAPPPPQKVVTAEPPHNARIATPVAEPAVEPSKPAADPVGTTQGFRWPVRGRIIAGFGPKPTGQQNDGINIAVPEGTPIKSAEDGVVAYAGNELKGYGNLVLVRHSNGYVTAYAHASELVVKRGDHVKRGQIIGRAGQTGSVTSPQLHFEVRKGSAPVDPIQFLDRQG